MKWNQQKKIELVTFPLNVFETVETKDDLKDWLLAHNPEFVKRMRKGRQDDLEGKGRVWDEVKKRTMLCIE